MSLNDFVILQKLGSGSFASVYKARRLIDQQIYALKKIEMKALGSKEKNNALNQIRLLACLSSPYIIGYCESFFDEKHDVLTIAMEYANEGDLFKKIEKQKKQKSLIPEVEVWKVFIHLLYGLNELHTNGVYKIGDMNVSKIIKNGLASTQTGTPYYASPEVWNDQPYNQKSDIWSLGCILYEIASLRPPYEASSMDKLFDMVTCSPTPKIPPNYSRELQLIVESCLQKNPVNRPSTKELLSNGTLKIYQNLLIDFKPQVTNELKSPLLKTIYMPNSKKELKNQLPQSNYKISQQKINVKEEKPQKNQIQKQSQPQVKPILTKIDNLLKNNEGEKNQASQKCRNRIKSCQIFKQASCKKISSSSKQNLMARADLIIESQRKASKSREKQVIHQNHSSALVQAPKLFEKKNSIKEIPSICKPPIQSSKQKSQIELKKQIFIEDEEIIVPKKLIFDQDTIEKNQSEHHLKIQSVLKNKSSTQAEKKQSTLAKQVYLEESIANISFISSTNHEHYKFETESEGQKQLIAKIIQIQQKNETIEKFEASLPEVFPISSAETTVLDLKPVEIVIDVHQNPQIINSPQKMTSRTTMSFLLGIQKLKNITRNVNFKNTLFCFGSIKNEYLRLKMIAHQSQIQLKIYNQSQKTIKETLEPIKQKVNTQNTPSKTFQKRSRSKSIRKTEKFKPLVAQNIQNANNASLMDKINQKISIELNSKKKSKEKSAKKEHKTNKKIFDKENNQFKSEQFDKNSQKIKQMVLVPKNLESSGSKTLSREISKPIATTQHKTRNDGLQEKYPKNFIEQQHKTETKLNPNNGLILFEQKKKKIFETPSSSNLVHDLNNRLEKINLDKKMKKYINF